MEPMGVDCCRERARAPRLGLGGESRGALLRPVTPSDVGAIQSRPEAIKLEPVAPLLAEIEFPDDDGPVSEDPVSIPFIVPDFATYD